MAVMQHESALDGRYLVTARNTRSAYDSQWRLFVAWCERHGLEAMPAQPDTLARYVQDRAAAGCRLATLKQAAAAIAWRHEAEGHQSPKTGAVRQLIRGIARTSPAPRQVMGLRWEQVDEIVQLAAAAGLSGLRDAAVIACMSDAMLRISEAAALDVQDLEAEAPDTVTIRRSKTDQDGVGVVLPLRSETVDRLRTWLREAKITSGAMFRPVHHGVVLDQRFAPKGVRLLIIRRARAAGIEGKVSGHSLRVGSAQSLAAAGASLVEMQLAGRWKSPSLPGHYARGALAQRGAVIKYRMGEGEQKSRTSL